ncbi:hypothetical protein JHK87_053237 [Glycine soja]|nr:hypothetical protein JHK87_053237 [Glycine soja]
MIFDHYLKVQLWSPKFVSPTTRIEKTLVWIQFPWLNLVYYDESILLALARAVGKPVKVNINTKDASGEASLHRICGSCGCYGHLTRDCKKELVIAQPSPSAEKFSFTEQPQQPGAMGWRKLGPILLGISRKLKSFGVSYTLMTTMNSSLFSLNVLLKLKTCVQFQKKWNAPCDPFFKLNTNGSSMRNPGRSRFGDPLAKMGSLSNRHFVALEVCPASLICKVAVDAAGTIFLGL